MYRNRIRAALTCLAFLCLLTAAARTATAASEYYVADGKIVAISPPLDEKSVSRAADRFAYLYGTYLLPNRMQAYVAVIPDKSYYLPDEKKRGQMDYAAIFALVYKKMDYAIPIDITDCLDKDSYYATDSHWRQECLLSAADRIAGCMLGDFRADGTHSSKENLSSSPSYETKVAADHFIGSYAKAIREASGWEKRAFSSVEPDTIRYLTNDLLEQAAAYRYDTDTSGGLYDWDKLDSRNPYDFFLSGPVALMRLENPSSGTDRKLVVFRDSYGSSLLPLLLPYYKEILVVDIRYMMSSRLGDFVDFTAYSGADALYLYSTTLLNRSISFR